MGRANDARPISLPALKGRPTVRTPDKRKIRTHIKELKTKRLPFHLNDTGDLPRSHAPTRRSPVPDKVNLRVEAFTR